MAAANNVSASCITFTEPPQLRHVFFYNPTAKVNILGTIERTEDEESNLVVYKAFLTSDKVKRAVYGKIELHVTTKHVFVNRIDNLSRGKLTKIGIELMQSAVHESFFVGLKGRVELEAVASHAFYVRCGFIPTTYCTKYGSDLHHVTEKLKKLNLDKTNPTLDAVALTKDKAVQEAITILADHHEIQTVQVSLDYIRVNWFWDDNYPKLSPKEVVLRVKRTVVAAKKQAKLAVMEGLDSVTWELTPKGSEAFKEKILKPPLKLL
jgi:hypothetical protein